MAAHIFGLDIGRSFVKTVELNGGGKQKTLKAVGSVQTPGGGIQSESQVELAKVSEAIRQCVNSAKIEASECVVSIIESQVVSRLIELPNLTDKELAAAINWEAEQYIPMPIKDVNLQYKVVSKGETTGKISVLLIAAPKRVIEKYINIVHAAGLKPVAFETESLALARSLYREGDPTTIIVSLGAASTELVVVYGANVVFTRSIATGGMALTRAIMNEFNLPQNQAEEYKQTYGILTDKLSGKVANVLKPVLEILAVELVKAIEYTHTHVAGSSVSRVVICGGGSFLPGFSEFLAERTSLEISLGDPWADFSKEGLITKLTGQGSVYAVATGLALRQ
ncbi:MAG: type IV pilus assembly protein PilM [Candidatus Curtissbacteria bacterium]|nr:type IV pilus assembly protein PilM [Candidatus Curtissbacteria bacterium]